MATLRALWAGLGMFGQCVVLVVGVRVGIWTVSGLVREWRKVTAWKA